MRVYEWGPTTGPKVVMVPQDTTPAPIFGVIADGLIDRGFRVLVLDTWGRGYSDSPLSVLHEVGLYEMQILFAVSSSDLNWKNFSIIGFSLGGAITMSFASHFPNMIESIILLAPAGVIRTLPKEYMHPAFRYHQCMPAAYLRRVVAGAVGVNTRKQVTLKPGKVSREEPDLPALWQWQFNEHEGFVNSFADTVQKGPLQYQQHSWQKACDIICGKPSQSSKLGGSQVLVVCGESDAVVDARETKEELSRLLPSQMVFRTVPGGHGFPIPSGKATLRYIAEFWKLPRV